MEMEAHADLPPLHKSRRLNSPSASQEGLYSPESLVGLVDPTDEPGEGELFPKGETAPGMPRTDDARSKEPRDTSHPPWEDGRTDLLDSQFNVRHGKGVGAASTGDEDALADLMVDPGYTMVAGIQPTVPLIVQSSSGSKSAGGVGRSGKGSKEAKGKAAEEAEGGATEETEPDSIPAAMPRTEDEGVRGGGVPGSWRRR